MLQNIVEYQKYPSYKIELGFDYLKSTSDTKNKNISSSSKTKLEPIKSVNYAKIAYSY